MGVCVSNWEQLEKYKDLSETHILVIDKRIGNCWIKPKNGGKGAYLSTHTFYSKEDRQAASNKLQKCGFNIILNEWEKQDTDYYVFLRRNNRKGRFDE